MNRNKPFNNLPLLPPAIKLETEIVLKKAIENIITTNDELYKAVADEKLATDPHSKEALRYSHALWYGFNSLKEKPLATNLFIEIVAIIKGKEIGIRRIPGTKIGNSRGEIIYTPPEGEEVIRNKLANLEQFIHADDELDPLIRLAIMHYQFEAIHPFADGNGRTGRILNILFLAEKGLLDTPILFLSRYILRTRSYYYEGLRRVTEEKAWIDWVLYILQAIETTAQETLQQVTAILDAMEKTKTQVKNEAPQIYSKDLIDIIFEHPYCKIQFLEKAGLVKRQTAATYLKTLEQLGILQSIKMGTEKYYINKALIKIFSK